MDWIVEAVVENPAVKSDLYARLDKVRKPGSIVSSNTSTIPLKNLIEGQSERFAEDFLITHFFNPPRYMRLLEVVAGPATRAEAVDIASAPSPTSGWARASCSARTGPASSPTGSAPTGFRPPSTRRWTLA